MKNLSSDSCSKVAALEDPLVLLLRSLLSTGELYI